MGLERFARSPRCQLVAYSPPREPLRVIMYAIIVDGGRQYKVQPGQHLDIDLRQDVGAGDTLEFANVLAIGGDEGLKLGSPAISGAKVTATVIGTEKGDKVYIQKFRRRKNYQRRTGHRQKYTRVEIGEIAS
jgi:large subunit ribosomal protein L21